MSYVELYNNNFRNLLEFASKDQPNNQHANHNSHNPSPHGQHHHMKKSSHSTDDLREDHLKNGTRLGQQKSNAKRRGSFDRS